MAIEAILTVYTSARDVNGNCYHAAEYIDCATGVTVRFGNIGGRNNLDSLPGLLKGERYTDWSTVYKTEQTLPIREWNRLTKGWPYLANHADGGAVAAVREAIAALSPEHKEAMFNVAQRGAKL